MSVHASVIVGVAVVAIFSLLPESYGVPAATLHGHNLKIIKRANPGESGSVCILSEKTGKFVRVLSGGDIDANGIEDDPSTVFTSTFSGNFQTLMLSSEQDTSKFLGLTGNGELKAVDPQVDSSAIVDFSNPYLSGESLLKLSKPDGSKCYLAFESDGQPVASPCDTSLETDSRASLELVL